MKETRMTPTPEQIRERLAVINRQFADGEFDIHRQTAGMHVRESNDTMAFLLSLLDQRDAEIEQWKCNSRENKMIAESGARREELAESSLLRMTEERDQLQRDLEAVSKDLVAASAQLWRESMALLAPPEEKKDDDGSVARGTPVTLPSVRATAPTDEASSRQPDDILQEQIAILREINAPEEVIELAERILREGPGAGRRKKDASA